MKRCPSFSKRPGFPSGLRVLLVDADSSARTKTECLLKDCNYTVTSCSTTAEALLRLSSGTATFDVLLADKAMVSGRTRDRQQLLHSSRELPCILMAADPQPSDIYQGIELGAVDFLAKPLSPLKLRNIWQHTVRKMMSDMTLDCPSEVAGADGHQEEGPGSEQMLEEDEDMEGIIEAEMAMLEQQAIAAAAAAASTVAPSSELEASRDAGSLGSLPTLQEGALSRSASVAASCLLSPAADAAPSNTLLRSASVGAVPLPSPVKPPRPGVNASSSKPKVHSSPSTASLKSSTSTTSFRSSATALVAPSSPTTTTTSGGASGMELCSAVSGELSSMATSGAAEGAAAAAASGGSSVGSRCKVKKAVRHLASANVANRPPLAIKPHTLAPIPNQGAPLPAATPSGSAATSAAPATAAAAVAAPAAVAPATAAPAAAPAAPAPPMGMPMNLAAVPLPTGLGPLPQGMVWGMPMCPLARAPGIVPPTNTPAALPWGMANPGMMPGSCGPMPMLAPMGGLPPFMAGFPLMACSPAGGMAVALPPQMTAAAAVPAPGLPLMPAAAAPVPMAVETGAPAAEGVPATGAAAAAALDASLASCEGCPVPGMEPNSLQFMLGDVTAEDEDLDVLALKAALPESFNEMANELETKAQGLCALEGPLGPTLGGELAAEADRVGLCLTGLNSQQQKEAAAGAASGSCCSQLQRYSSMSSHRSSFESVSSGISHSHVRHALMGGGLGAGGSGAKSGLSSLGSFSDLFAVDSHDSPESSEDRMTRADSSHMLAELESLFGMQDGQEESSEGGLFEGLELPLSLNKSSGMTDMIAESLDKMEQVS